MESADGKCGKAKQGMQGIKRKLKVPCFELKNC
jgi:hypothetical protein